MRVNLFLERSKILMRIWAASCVVWLLLVITQTIMGYKNSGFSGLFERKMLGFEMYISCLFLSFFVSCWLIEIWKCNALLKEYSSFIRGIKKSRSMKRLLFKLKMSILLIMISCFFCIMAGMLEKLNIISVLFMVIVKIYYIFKYRVLIDRMDPNYVDYVEEAKKYG